MEKQSVAERLNRGVAWLLLIGFFFLTACAASRSEAQNTEGTDSNSAPAVQTDTAQSEAQRTEGINSNSTPAVQTETAQNTETTKLLLPEASGTIVNEGNGVTIDASHTDQGYVMVRCAPSDKRLKARVSTPAQTYYYDLPGGDTYSVFPLQMGDGAYTVRVMEQVENDLYAMRYGVDISVSLSSETIPFLYPNQYVWYDETTKTVQKANELAAGLTSDAEIAKLIYGFVVDHMSYDQAKAETVPKGYVPSVDEALDTGKGICFDYAVLLAVMLRAEGIPTKMLIGFVTSDNLYHSWNSVYLNGEWVWMDPTLDKTGHIESVYIIERTY